MSRDVDQQGVENHLDAIEYHVRAARGEDVHRTPWDFNLPTGDDLRHMRNECGLSRDELADGIGYSKQSVANWENGYEAPGRQAIQIVLRYLKMEWPRTEASEVPQP